MFKKLLITTLTGALLFFTYSWGIVPHIINKRAETLLSHFNLQSFQTTTQRSTHNSLSYIGAAFDGADNINTVGKLTLTLKPGDFSTDTIDQINLENLELIGGLDETNNYAIHLEGIDLTALRPGLLASKARTITIKNFDITLITEHYGGLSITGELTATRTANGDYTFIGSFKSKQRFITLTGTINGSISANHLKANYEILQGKIGIQSHTSRLTRLSGTATLTEHNKAITLKSTLLAGAFRIGRLQWKNASLTLAYTNKKPTITLHAMSLADDDITLSLTHENNRTQGMIHIADPNKRNAYLKEKTIEQDGRHIVKLQKHNLIFAKAPNGLTFRSVPADNTK